MDVNNFSYEDEMDAAIVGALSACVVVLEILVDYNDNSGEDIESIPRIPSSSRNEIRRKYVQNIIGVDDATSIKMIRMNRRTFYQLCEVVRRRNLLHDTIHVTVQEQLLMFLHTIAHNVRNGIMFVNYLRSGETVSRYFNHVIKALRQLHNDYIRPPDTAIPDEIRSREIYWPWFKDCVGAIDGTHILASVPSDIVARFRGKSSKPTQNVLAAVRFDLTFSYVLASWEGSAHDVCVLNDALQRQNRLIVPNGKYFLVDAGYSTRPGFISPYRGVRYHLKHFGDHTPTNKELFNLRHSSLRTTVERAFGLLKRRFRMEGVQSQDTSSSKKGNNNFRWSISMSKFMQKYLVEQATNGMKVDKSFKRPAFVATTRAVSEKFKVTCSDSNVENHLRTLKTKYAAIKKLKGMSGVGWNDDEKMITMSDDTFNEYIAAHPKDEPYINKPIEMYEELVVIYGDDQATGSFSRAVADAVVDVDSTSVNEVNEETSETPPPPPPRSIEDHCTSSEQVKRGKKRKRDIDFKIDLLANKIGDLASAISWSRNRDISMELYEEVMKCKGYDKSELVKAFDYLLANEIQARSFLARDESLRQMWLEDFFKFGPS